MDFAKPLWHPSLAGLLIRVPIGIYFFLSGRLLMQDVNGFIDGIKAFEVMPDSIATLYAVVLPYAQILIGFLLVVGFWTSLSAILAALLLASFIYAFGIYPNEVIPFNKDIVWFMATLALLSTGPGAFSIDRFREKGG